MGELFQDVRGAFPAIPDTKTGPKILQAEVSTAIKKMRKNKATGPDGIVIEMIEALEEYGIDKVTDVVNKTYDDENFPKDLSKLVFIAIPKKPGAIDCGQHHTISVMRHFTN